MIRGFILLLPVVLFVSSCAMFKAPEFHRVNEVQLRDLTPNHTSLDLSVVISNPNWYAITVKSLDLEVSDKNRDKLGNIVMTKPLRIEKHDADTVYFEIRMDTRKVARVLSYTSDKVEFIVRADALAKVMGISKRVRLEQPNEVNFTKIISDILPTIPEDIEIPTIRTKEKKSGKKETKLLVSDPVITPAGSSPAKPDIFKVMRTSITDIDLKETELTIRFLLLNPYGLAFTFRDFPADVWINEKFAGKGKLSRPLVFNENVFSSEGELVFKLNNFNSVLLASKALMRKDMNYQVNGTLIVDGFGTTINKPFRFKGAVELGKKDKEK
jgi:LEA14-like dessication related protein